MPRGRTARSRTFSAASIRRAHASHPSRRRQLKRWRTTFSGVCTSRCHARERSASSTDPTTRMCWWRACASSSLSRCGSCATGGHHRLRVVAHPGWHDDHQMLPAHLQGRAAPPSRGTPQGSAETLEVPARRPRGSGAVEGISGRLFRGDHADVNQGRALVRDPVGSQVVPQLGGEPAAHRDVHRDGSEVPGAARSRRYHTVHPLDSHTGRGRPVSTCRLSARRLGRPSAPETSARTLANSRCARPCFFAGESIPAFRSLPPPPSRAGARWAPASHADDPASPARTAEMLPPRCARRLSRGRRCAAAPGRHHAARVGDRRASIPEESNGAPTGALGVRRQRLAVGADCGSVHAERAWRPRSDLNRRSPP